MFLIEQIGTQMEGAQCRGRGAEFINKSINKLLIKESLELNNDFNKLILN